jgi:plasmid replication initiation protein
MDLRSGISALQRTDRWIAAPLYAIRLMMFLKKVTRIYDSLKRRTASRN